MVVVVSMRVMSAGRGYQYLLKSVAAGDGDRDLGTPLTRYYVHEGSPPGVWYGSGLSGLDSDPRHRISAGDEVTEEHLARLLGSGVDPVIGERLGLAYGRYQTPRQRVAARLAALPEAEREGAAATGVLGHCDHLRVHDQPCWHRLAFPLQRGLGIWGTGKRPVAQVPPAFLPLCPLACGLPLEGRPGPLFALP